MLGDEFEDGAMAVAFVALHGHDGAGGGGWTPGT
jgi:hypothetical protein